MDGRTPFRCAVFVLASTVFTLPLFAQYVCDYGNGPLNSAAPEGITPAEIIETFATHEAGLKEARDLVIVKTCGKTRGDEIGGSWGKNSANLTPTFVTYREQIDGKYWFTTYARADEFLHFPTGGVHIREVVKYSDYKAPALK